jgi:exopolysaccharide biosynthesis polyprenyl glycosylphosphotransferase
VGRVSDVLGTKTAGSSFGVPSATARPVHSGWTRRYLKAALAADALAVLAAAVIADVVRFRLSDAGVAVNGGQVPYVVVTVLLVPIWLSVMALGGSYDSRTVGAGAEEYREIIRAGFYFFAVIAIVHLVLKLDIARGFLAACVPLAVLLTVTGRYFLRKRLHRSRARGRSMTSVLLVGSREPLEALARHFMEAPWTGFAVAGACSTEPEEPHSLNDDEMLLVVGGTDSVLRALEDLEVDALVVADTTVFARGELRRLSWVLEGSGVELIVAPAVTDIVGPRISTRPIAGLPLLHVEQPRFSLGGRAFKAVFDPIAAVTMLVLLSPMLLAAAIAVACTSRGPVFYRQVRIGLEGCPFSIVKFRTMVRGADELQASITENDADGVLFKLRRDPRVTRVGRVLRRWSIDEIPQLAQVVTGKMSLVGPRPPLESEVDQYAPDLRRRLLVKPGLTGLWQVSGRSDLPWDEAVRLDLHYVDNWSPTMDLAILLKTARAVVRGTGAY